MRFPTLLLSLIAAAGLATVSIPTAQAALFQSGDSVSISTPVSDDAFLAGKSVSITSPVSGDLFLAGSTIVVSERVGRSAFLAGSDITLSKGAAYNFFGIGKNITLDGEFGHDVYVAGDSIKILPTTVIHGNLYVGGNIVNLAGTVNGMVKAESDDITISNSTIGGDFTYYSNNAVKGAETAKIGGKTERKDSPASSSSSNSNDQTYAWIVGLFASLLTAAVVWSLVPQLVLATQEEAKTNYGKSIFNGFAILILVPIAALIAIATLIGWKVGLILLFLYSLIILLAAAMIPMVIGRYVLAQTKAPQADHPWLQILVGALLIHLLGLIPSIGGFAQALLASLVFLPMFGATFRVLPKLLNRN